MLVSKDYESRQNDILAPEEVAHHLQKSLSWVYKNWRLLGGEKIRGALFFSNEVIYKRLFGDKV